MGGGRGKFNRRPAAHWVLRHLWVRQGEGRASAELLAMRADRIHQQHDAPPPSTLNRDRTSLFAAQIDIAETF